MKDPFKNIDVKIDEKKLRRMRFRVYGAEQENLSTRKHSREKMKDEIRKIIIEEYRKNI